MTGPPQRPTSNDDVEAGSSELSNSVYAALARTTARGVGLYFARPMRLFRPTKISGWTTLRNVAAAEGTSLSLGFLSNLVRTQGALAIPRHFIPPLLVNTCLGTILFTTYTTTYEAVHQSRFCANSTAASAVAGATAGAVQSVAGAPAENVRLYLEGGMTGQQNSVQGWRQAWKEVFVDSSQQTPIDKRTSRREAREIRGWMREVGGMAGRGWDGWGWSCAKDTCGFALFFAVFDISRHIATHVSEALAPPDSDMHAHTWRPFSGANRVVQSLVLVGGGVVGGLGHEIMGRPFDTARRVLHLHETHVRTERINALKSVSYPLPTVFSQESMWSRIRTSAGVLRDISREEGYLYFFRSSTPTSFDTKSSPYQRLHTALRTLGRVGPWGAAFVVWEATGGISV